MSRREQLEEMLASDPDDVFLQYALAMECVSAGDVEDGLTRLAALNSAHPEYIAAWFQRGQALAGEGRSDEARDVLQQGIAEGKQVGDAHAVGEMTEFLASL